MSTRRKASPKNDPDAQEYVRVRAGDLQPHPDNPNNGDGEAIDESIDENGFYGLVIVQKSTGRILIGNHRWAEWIKKYGEDRPIPACMVDVDDERALKIMLADNATRQGAKTDEGLVAKILRKLPTSRGTGYRAPQVEAILKATRPQLGYLAAMREGADGADEDDDEEQDGEEGEPGDGGPVELDLDDAPHDAEDEDGDEDGDEGAEEDDRLAKDDVPRHPLAIVLSNAEMRIYQRVKGKLRLEPRKKSDRDAFLAMLSRCDVEG